MRRTLTLVVLASVTASVVACVAGYRGKAAFRGLHDIAGIEEVRIELPDTPIDIRACTAVVDDPELCPEELAYRGIWDAIAGTGNDAQDNASAPTLEFVREDGFAVLSAVIPLRVAGLVGLTMETIELPDDRDVHVVGGVGDVAIEGMRATVTVEVEIGDIEIRGGDAGVGVSTGQGTVTVVTAGHADIRSERGQVDVEQTAGARDLLVETGSGSITVTLASDADIELVAKASGTIRVDTPQITAVAHGAFERRLGTGAVKVELTTASGGIVVRTR